jgi:hypothetical protein
MGRLPGRVHERTSQEGEQGARDRFGIGGTRAEPT